ncbi:MAG: S-methyl-5-thioribose-1-phosphate isomerase, partial [Candidatus Limnocylindrales bacterium]
VAPVTNAVRRVVRAWEAELERTDDDALAAGAARREADAIAGEAAQAMTDLVAVGVAALAQPEGRPLVIMTHDSTGALAGGLVGGALGVVLAIAAGGRPVHVWLLETHPGGAGARLAAWELAAAGVPTTVVADGSAAWLLGHATVDAVLVGADRVAADGATTAVIGTLGLAELAHRHAVPLWVVTPLVAVDPAVADAAASAVESERYADIGVALVAREAIESGVEARGPLQDVTPPELIAGVVTEAGVLRPPFGPALAAVSPAAVSPASSPDAPAAA